MKSFRRLLALVLLAVLVTGILPVAALADEFTEPDATVLSNDYIKVTVDNNTGRFGIRTVDGQPIRKKDQNVNLTFGGDDPETSFTTFRIDGTDYIFGNPYKFGVGFFSEISKPQVVTNPNGTKQIETVWSIKGVQIKQVLMLFMDIQDKVNSGNVDVRYEVYNSSGADVQVGSRILLDTMVGSNDGPAFQVGTAYKVPLQVERKLTHHPENDPSISEADRALYQLPSYWVMKDKLDSTNPLATNVIAYGFNNFYEANINIVDEMVVGHWNRMANTKWDYSINPNLDFTTDTNDFGTADSAVAFYWNPQTITSGNYKSFETVYGLGEIVEPEKVFSVRYMDPVQQLPTLADNSDYENEGVFDIVAEVENLASFNMEHSELDIELTLDSGLDFVRLDEIGSIVRNSKGKIETLPSRSVTLNYRKEATPAEADAGIQPKYKPGETVAASFKVKAKGRPWPTTKQYLLTVRSPETEQKLESLTDESIKAQYASSKSNFVFLPPVGQATQTFAYAMSPEEVFSSDVKYITVNLSNIEAYNTGNETADPNFDLFFKELATGKRYKVPVKDSVLLQPANDGQVGDMRITYRTGDLVDAYGKVINGPDGKPMSNLGQELPLGEYVVEIDYKGDTGDDPEAAQLYDIVTTQKFKVSDNEKTRIRQANILAIVKTPVDLTATFADKNKQAIEKAYPGYKIKSNQQWKDDVETLATAKLAFNAAAKVLDPSFDMTNALKVDNVPSYKLMTFESADELVNFEAENLRKKLEAQTDSSASAAAKAGVEILVDIRGMIKQIGTDEKAEYVVDTRTEPAIINGSVAYKGKEMVFAKGQLDVLGINKVAGFKNIPFFNSLSVKGEGTLSVASSGFVFHSGEWSLDFYNGFSKDLTQSQKNSKGSDDETDEEKEEEAEENEKNKSPEDDSKNGSLKWAVGGLGDRINPLRQVVIPDVYFNKHSLFAAPSFSIAGFGLKFNDFILRDGGISFGGGISLKIVDAEVKNVMFNNKGFVGIDAGLSFELGKDIGLISAGGSSDKSKQGVSGEINIVHYEQPVFVDGIEIRNTYGLKFDASLKKMAEVGVEIEFKQVPDGRILPNVLGFKAGFNEPGVIIAGATYLTGIRGAIRELADTIAGVPSVAPQGVPIVRGSPAAGVIPLTLEAGVDVTFGITPATFRGSIDLTLKMSGIKLMGRLDYSPSATAARLQLLKQATIAAQWMTPWFVSASAEVDIGGWDVIIGKASFFVGQNLQKNRIDWEGFVSAKLQVPSSVPVVGGMALAGASLGVNNDKIWGSLEILIIKLGITYYWGGGIEFGTSGEDLPEGLAYLQIQEPEEEPKLMVIGQGVRMLATSWESKEEEHYGVIYRNVGDGVSIIDNGAMNAGIGGIEVSNAGKTHRIPMAELKGDALLEVEYFESQQPELILKDNAGVEYPLVFDPMRANPQANSFTQHISSEDSGVGYDVRKAYIMIPKERISGGNWTLYSNQKVESKLLDIPQVASLDEIKLTPSGSNANEFTASWKASNVKEGDKISLYLTKDAVNNTPPAAGEEVRQPGEAGLLIAKDLVVANNGGTSGNVTTGSKVIDVTQVQLLGATEDIRGLLSQGDYYIRAELKSDTGFETKTTENRFELIDPLAPNEVSDVRIKPVGNGYFELSFKPAARKDILMADEVEHSYAIEVLQQTAGQLAEYPNFSSLLYTEDQLKTYWNEQNGTYEHIRLGGWTAVSTSDDPNAGSVKYTGLEVGQEYVVAVSAAAKPTEQMDKNKNYHYSKRIDTASTLLPVPSKPKLSSNPYLEVRTNSAQQSIEITADQPDIQIQAIYDESLIGSADLVNQGSGSNGTLSLSNFTTDGTYAVELQAVNKNTGDYSITILYLTVDTIAPVLYIDKPLTGERTSNGSIAVSGTTSNDAVLKVNGTPIAVKEDGTFSGSIPVTGNDPTVELEFEAYDQAGNRNEAAVNVTNGAYKVPVALVLKPLSVLKPEQSGQIEAYLRIADGKDGSGKARYKDIAIPEIDRNKLSFSDYLGDAAFVSNSGIVTGVRNGSSIVSAEYRISDDLALQTMTVVKVDTETGELGLIKAASQSVSGKNNVTRVAIQAAGELTGHELVYKVYPRSTVSLIPGYLEDLSQWTVLPGDGVITAVQGDSIVVAKRKSADKAAVAVSGSILANVWTPSKSSGGGGGGGGGGTTTGGQSGTTINGVPADAQKVGDSSVVSITDAAVSSNGKSEIAVISDDNTVKGYVFNIGESVLAKAVERNQSIRFDLPIGGLVIPAHTASSLGKELKVAVAQNSSEDRQVFGKIAGELQANLLGGGQGVTFDIQAPNAFQNGPLQAKVALPEGVEASQITAVVLKDANGNWTPVPWKLGLDGGKAFADIQLTGNGSIAFIRNGANFADVGDTNWAKESIAQAAGKLFMLGRQADQFVPDSTITRAEYPTVLLRVLGLMNWSAEHDFADVSQSDWYSRSLAIAADVGIVNGFEDGSFRPNEMMSRLDAMVMAGRGLKLAGMDGSLTASETDSILEGFADHASIPDWAKESVALCIKNGIITGQGDSIDPNDALTRAQAAAISVRLDHNLTAGAN